MNKIMFSEGDTLRVLIGSQKDKLCIVTKVVPMAGMETNYHVEFDCEPFNLVLTESSLENEYLFEMANVHPNVSGLKTSLHALGNGAAMGLPHGPRVKVTTNQHGMVPIQLRPEVKLAVTKSLRKEDTDIINVAISYISSNLQLFLDHWDGKIDDKELLNSLPKI